MESFFEANSGVGEICFGVNITLVGLVAFGREVWGSRSPNRNTSCFPGTDSNTPLSHLWQMKDKSPTTKNQWDLLLKYAVEIWRILNLWIMYMSRFEKRSPIKKTFVCFMTLQLCHSIELLIISCGYLRSEIGLEGLACWILLARRPGLSTLNSPLCWSSHLTTGSVAFWSSCLISAATATPVPDGENGYQQRKQDI